MIKFDIQMIVNLSILQGCVRLCVRDQRHATMQELFALCDPGLNQKSFFNITRTIFTPL